MDELTYLNQELRKEFESSVLKETMLTKIHISQEYDESIPS